MYESLHISDVSLLRIISRFEEIVRLTKQDVTDILSQDIELEWLTHTLRERIKSLIAVCLLADRLRVYASYPYVLDPDTSLESWFHSPSDFSEGKSPLEFMKNNPHTGIEILRERMRDFFRDDTKM
jgi:hypothetical protein